MPRSQEPGGWGLRADKAKARTADWRHLISTSAGRTADRQVAARKAQLLRLRPSLLYKIQWISGSVDQWWKVLPRRSRGQTRTTRGDSDPPQGQLARPVLLPVC